MNSLFNKDFFNTLLEVLHPVRSRANSLNSLAVVFLEQTELCAREHKELTLDYWHDNVDRLLEFNERAVLEGIGSAAKTCRRVQEDKK